MLRNIRGNFRNKLISPLLRFLFEKILRKNLGNLYFPHIVFGKKIFGLSYVPTLEPEFSDQVDSHYLFGLLKSVPVEFSKKDAQVLKGELKRMGTKCKCILEIGVSRNFDTSSTKIIIDNKLSKTIYLGIDITKKSQIENFGNLIYTMKVDSRNISEVMSRLRRLGCKEIDLLVIDGFHSVEMAIIDWDYSRYLSKNGVVVIHDTSVHPGPAVLYEAIDRRVFTKQRYFVQLPNDWGISVVRKKYENI